MSYIKNNQRKVALKRSFFALKLSLASLVLLLFIQLSAVMSDKVNNTRLFLLFLYCIFYNNSRIFLHNLFLYVINVFLFFILCE